MSHQSDDEEHENEALAELKRKQHHPYRLHPELWYNEKGEVCNFEIDLFFYFLWETFWKQIQY